MKKETFTRHVMLALICILNADIRGERKPNKSEVADFVISEMKHSKAKKFTPYELSEAENWKMVWKASPYLKILKQARTGRTPSNRFRHDSLLGID